MDADCKPRDRRPVFESDWTIIEDQKLIAGIACPVEMKIQGSNLKIRLKIGGIEAEESIIGGNGLTGVLRDDAVRRMIVKLNQDMIRVGAYGIIEQEPIPKKVYFPKRKKVVAEIKPNQQWAVDLLMGNAR